VDHGSGRQGVVGEQVERRRKVGGVGAGALVCVAVDVDVDPQAGHTDAVVGASTGAAGQPVGTGGDTEPHAVPTEGQCVGGELVALRNGGPPHGPFAGGAVDHEQGQPFVVGTSP
jgi:hypothetical protein